MAAIFECSKCGKRVKSAGVPSGKEGGSCPNRDDGTPHLKGTPEVLKTHKWVKISGSY